MPGKLKVKVLAGRNLPVMDRAGDTTDAFVEIKFGNITHKTDVCRKSLNPHWNSTEWYRFEVDDSELQDEPLQLRLMDHDTYSANDAIGKVVVSLAPLLAREPAHSSHAAPHSGAVMSGWIPVFDTLHGIRGELNIIVKVELFSDFNKFRQSSCGVQFFHCPMIPSGYAASCIHGFVEELIVNDDPEYQWIDKIRTPRASNEARQVAFIKLSNQVQRLVGLKAAELGANAVIGYQQSFDLEGEAGVVARAIGTAVSIEPLPMPSQPIPVPTCTQHQLKKYIDILAADNEDIPDLNAYFQTHQDQLQKFLHVLHPNTPNLMDDESNIHDDFELARQSSVKTYTESVSIYQDEYPSQQSLQNIADDQFDLNKLLNPDDPANVETETVGPLKRFKKLTKKSHGFISRISRLKSKKAKADDQVSIKSTSSEASKISLSELKSEFHRFRRFKKPKILKLTVEDGDDAGIGMASILARSVIHAHTSLACIAETQDSGDSPGSTMRKLSGSEPAVNISDDEVEKNAGQDLNTDTTVSIKSDENKIPELRFTSLTNVSKNEGTRVRKLSESCPASPSVDTKKEHLLNLPNAHSYYGSASLSGESSELVTSSDEDDDSDDDNSSDLKTDYEKYETVTSVVQNVLKHEIDPIFVAHMEKKLDELRKGSLTPELIDSRSQTYVNPALASTADVTNVSISFTNNSQSAEANTHHEGSSSSNNEANHDIKNKENTRFKLPKFLCHKNTTKSISVPSSPVERSSSFNFLKGQLSKVTKGKVFRSFSNVHLKQKKIVNKAESVSDSNSDIRSVSSGRDTVLGSPFLSYTDLLNIAESESSTKPISPSESNFKVSQDNVNKTFKMYIGSEPTSRASCSGPSSKQSIAPSAKHSNAKFEDLKHFRDNHRKKSDSSIKPSSMIQTAMKTILMDKVQTLTIPSTPANDEKQKQFFEDVNVQLEKLEDENLMKDQNLSLPPTSEDSKISKLHTESTTKSENSKKLVRQNSFDLISSESAANIECMSKKQSVQKLESQTKQEKLKEVVCDPESEEKSNDNTRSVELDNVNLMKNFHINLDDVQKYFSHDHSSSTPILQHFHPILGGHAPKLSSLETIPSMPESSIDLESNETPPSHVDHELTKSTKELQSNKNYDHNKDTDHTPKEREDATTTDNQKSDNGKSKEDPSKIVISNTEASQSIPTLKLNKPHPRFSKRSNIGGSERMCDNSHGVRPAVGRDKGSPRHARAESVSSRDEHKGTPVAPHASANSSSTPVGMQRRSSDSDLSITPKGGSLTASGTMNASAAGGAILRPSMNANNLDMLEYPFLTMTEYPPGFIVHIGGTVCARSVKLMEGLGEEGGGGGGRAACWAELRTELRAHARALRCTAVLAYAETATICEDVCVLSVSGTAAVIDLDVDLTADPDLSLSLGRGGQSAGSGGWGGAEEEGRCSLLHVPYSTGTLPYAAELPPCLHCHKARVPGVMLATLEKPSCLQAAPKTCLVTAAACRMRRAAPQSEPGARDISDQLPFLEYELHRLLLAKLRMQGANAVFGLRTALAVGERCVVALASGTGYLLRALPPPAPPTLKSSNGNEKSTIELQKALCETFAYNRAFNGYDVGASESAGAGAVGESETEQPPALELSGDRDACVLELDEAEEVEGARLLAARRCRGPPASTSVRLGGPARALPHAPPHAFAQVWRSRLVSAGGGGGVGGGGGAGAERQVARALDGVAYKLRRLAPCALRALRFQIDLPDEELQLLVTGAAVRLAAASDGRAEGGALQRASSDAIFAMDEEHARAGGDPAPADLRRDHDKWWGGVALSGLCGAAGGAGGGARRQRWVCALQLLFVRETSSVRELGGLSAFLHTFITEVLAVVRAYTAALGGNALVSFYMTELMLQDNPHKNQGQCLLSVGGDVVQVLY